MKDHVWVQLREQGIVQGERPENEMSDTPWYVKVLMAFSGWLAALFIFGFVAIAFELIFENAGLAGITGILMVAGAYSMLRSSDNEFLQHLGLATSFAGQAFIAYAIFELTSYNGASAWLLIVALQAVLVALMPGFLHSLISAFFASVALSIAFTELHIPFVVGGIVMFGTSYCWLNEFRYPRYIKKIRAAGYGLAFALVALKGANLFGDRMFGLSSSEEQGFFTQPWFGELLIVLVTLYVVWSLLQRYGQPVKSRLSVAALLATLFIGLLSMNAQGITVGIVIIWLGFFSANRVLLGAGVVSLLFYICSYYYLLDATLMEKSLSLLIVGLALLLGRWLMNRIIPVCGEVPHE